MTDTIIYIDGGSRGNPGLAAYGVRAETSDGVLMHEWGTIIGKATNNVAEYGGLLAALRWAHLNNHCPHIKSDSLLLVQQMKGIFKVKNPQLIILVSEARALVETIERKHPLQHVLFTHIPREQNYHADRLANEAMDGA